MESSDTVRVGLEISRLSEAAVDFIKLVVDLLLILPTLLPPPRTGEPTTFLGGDPGGPLCSSFTVVSFNGTDLVLPCSLLGAFLLAVSTSFSVDGRLVPKPMILILVSINYTGIVDSRPTGMQGKPLAGEAVKTKL